MIPISTECDLEVLVVRSWEELTAYVRAHYQHEEPADGYIFFTTSDEQEAVAAVFLARVQHPLDGPWAEMTTPVGQVDEIDLGTAVQQIGRYPCGGISAGMGLALVRHAFPIESTSESLFEVTRESLVVAAKHLAQEARK